jgi:hypothetical protein
MLIVDAPVETGFTAAVSLAVDRGCPGGVLRCVPNVHRHGRNRLGAADGREG